MYRVVLFAAAAVAAPVGSPEELINTLGGTKSRYDFSTGNILPEVILPWGMNGWSPMTDQDQGSWFFYSESRRLYGVRCTHQPSPWISDYGYFRIAASITDPGHADQNQYSGYSPAQSQWSPYYWNATLLGYGGRNGFTAIEVTPTTHGALFRFTFPKPASDALSGGWNQTRRVLFSFDGSGQDLAIGSAPSTGAVTVSGKATANSGGVPSNFGNYFYATVSGGADGNSPVAPLASSIQGGGSWGYADFQPSNGDSDVLVLRIATSFISAAQAQANHASEVEGVAFDAGVAAAKAAWGALLSGIDVSDVGPGYTPDQETGLLTTFYSSLYRAAKYPRSLAEVDAATGATVHWSPYDGAVHPGPMSVDFGFWDGYRTTHSLLALWAPSRLAEAMEGWLNAWQEGGWTPEWASPGYRAGMTGTMSDVSFAEAIVKLPHCGSQRAGEAGYCVNASALYAASRQNAFNAAIPSGGYAGRACLANYLQLGYLSSDGGCDAVVSRSLNYLHSDWALSQAATALGLPDDAALLLARSRNWSALLEPTTGFLRPRDSAGAWAPGFDEFAWGPSAGYTEAGPWQYRLEVPYDPQGLKTALAAIGQDACDVVQQANLLPSAFHMGGYGDEIHEQTEMAVNCWGQWELNNQPVWAMQHMQVAFDTSVTGKCASQAQYWLRRSTGLFKPGADMFPGDEDNGSMGSWHVLNAIGLYPLSPASGDYVLGSPLFANVSIGLPGGKTLIVTALNQGPANVYVQGARWNGAPVAGVALSYAALMQGGTLEFTMGPAPASPDAWRPDGAAAVSAAGGAVTLGAPSPQKLRGSTPPGAGLR